MVPMEPSTSALSFDESIPDLPLDLPLRLASEGQSHLAYTELAKALDVFLAVAAPVVGVRTRRLATQRGDLLDGRNGERRVGEILLGAGHGREHEAALQPRDAPGQSELDGLANLAAHDRIQLRDVQIDDLARSDETGAQPVTNLRQELGHRLV